MRQSRRPSCALLLTAVLALSLSATACGGGGTGTPDLVLVGFNVPNIAGVPLNQPLIFTFSNEIDPGSITPDTLRVVGALGPNFEVTVVDGNLIALLPRSPNFEDYSDAGLLPGVQYTVSMAMFPAPETIRNPEGKPLLDAESFQFTTVPTPQFIEPRRPIHHGLPPSAGGTSDDEGCLNNPDNSLETTKQFGSGPGARLLCLQNEGAPQIILDQCKPTHNDQAVGNPSAVTPGFINLPALRMRFNEPLDPITVVPYVPTDKFGLNVQLWLVGDTDRIPLPPRQIRSNKPLIVQSLTQTEIILVAANEDHDGNPVGGVPQGTYMVNITGAVTDLPGNALDTASRPSPAIGGFQDIDENVGASGDVPPGYRIYFVTLVVPGTPHSIVESYANNLAEWGDQDSGDTEPGVFTYSDLVDPYEPNDDLLLERIAGSLTPHPTMPSYTLISTRDGCGQSTVSNWNGGFRFLGLPQLVANPDQDNGAGVLKAVFRPYCGDGQDGVFETDGTGTEIGLSTNPGGSVDGDGIYEFESFHLRANDMLTVSGTQPLMILCRGDFILDGTLVMSGSKGGPGLDTDGDPRYENPASIPSGGPGGAAAPGGGPGGAGANPLDTADGKGETGKRFFTVFEEGTTDGGGGGLVTPTGGGGGGFGTAGADGTDESGTGAGNGGVQAGDPLFSSSLADFEPDRTYSPNANGSGGTGGGGGGLHDNDPAGTFENGDDGGGGGGGAGGGLYVIACGEVWIGGTIRVDGGAGGDTFAVADQVVDLGADDAEGGTDENADTVTGIRADALPSGAGGPGGGGAGGGLFFMGREGVTVTSTAVLSALPGASGESGNVDLVGGEGSVGIIALGVMGGFAIDVDPAASVDPALNTINPYEPTVETVSCGQSEWYDVFTGTGEFFEFRWSSNFDVLSVAGLNQATAFDALLEVQGADTLNPLPAEGTPSTATGLTNWTQINLNFPGETKVEFDGTPPSPIDGKRFFRYRWRFRLMDTYPATVHPMPAIHGFTIEFTR